jgi:hypothetical protein
VDSLSPGAILPVFYLVVLALQSLFQASDSCRETGDSLLVEHDIDLDPLHFDPRQPGVPRVIAWFVMASSFTSMNCSTGRGSI